MGWQTWTMTGCCWCWNLQPRHPPDPGGQSQDCQRLLSPLHQGLTRADRQPYLTNVRRGGRLQLSSGNISAISIQYRYRDILYFVNSIGIDLILLSS